MMTPEALREGVGETSKTLALLPRLTESPLTGQPSLTNHGLAEAEESPTSLAPIPP
jgi:hypothetical protein